MQLKFCDIECDDGSLYARSEGKTGVDPDHYAQDLNKVVTIQPHDTAPGGKAWLYSIYPAPAT